jgi:DNA-binding MarR family transcriptional regulator
MKPDRAMSQESQKLREAGFKESDARLLGDVAALGGRFMPKELLRQSGRPEHKVREDIARLSRLGFVQLRKSIRSRYYRLRITDQTLKEHIQVRAKELIEGDSDMDDMVDEANIRALGLSPSELRLLRFMFRVPDGEWIPSVKITAEMGITQATISEKARKLKERGWIESGQKGYRRTKSVEEIKSEMRDYLRNVQGDY